MTNLNGNLLINFGSNNKQNFFKGIDIVKQDYKNQLNDLKNQIEFNNLDQLISLGKKIILGNNLTNDEEENLIRITQKNNITEAKTQATHQYLGEIYAQIHTNIGDNRDWKKILKLIPRNLGTAIQKKLINLLNITNFKVDGLLGNKTKELFDKYFNTSTLKTQTVNLQNNQTNTQIDNNQNNINETLKKGDFENKNFLKYYNEILTNLNNNVLCTTFTQAYLMNVISTNGYIIPNNQKFRNLGSSRDLKQRCNNNYFTQKELYNKKPNEIKDIMKNAQPGTIFTLQYGDSNFKEYGVTHTIIATGGGNFEDFMSGSISIRKFNINDLEFNSDNGAIEEGKPTNRPYFKYGNHKYYFINDSREITINTNSLKKANKIEITANLIGKNEDDNIYLMDFIQKIADTFGIPKEHVTMELLKRYPNINLKGAYKIEKIHFNLNITNKTTNTINKNKGNSNIDNIIKISNNKYKNTIDTLRKTDVGKNINNNDFNSMMVILKIGTILINRPNKQKKNTNRRIIRFLK